ncbi:hybrid sensor histidine kinase/response regulator [Chitinophaga pendula]|uniref:hybrid sensor histidine kinase/response regulator n=1 Tax=Chitinophaga TaxID=79328 RepID=UPI0018DF1150|nr:MULTISPECIES: hybrid sensor histidine kinase/response regulator [Chitinophaga]UCJ07167.1 hybrid sensor histidine kinase/response regulator [Chitinophaga pendula]
MKDTLMRLLKTGTQGLEDATERRSVVIINTLTLIMVAMVLGIGLFFYYLKSSLFILIPVILEAVSFCAVFLLNRRKQYFYANATMFAIHSVATIYWATALGTAVPVEVIMAFLFMIVFHIWGSFLLYKQRKLLIACLIAGIFVTVGVQLNYHYKIIKPLQLDPQDANIMRWFTTGGFLFLIFLIMFSYIRRIEILLSALKHSNNVLSAKSAFLRETCHELRTPLNGVFMISQLFQLRKEKYMNSDEIAEIDDLYAASYTARNIVNSVLDLSIIESGRFYTIKKEALNLRSYVQHCATMNSYVANTRGITIMVDFDKRLPVLVNSDKIVLTKIINNLLSNAVKFSQPDSQVMIKVHGNDEHIFFQVKNKGTISREKIDRVFLPFESERNNFIEGTGLGLYITKHLVELLEGRIIVTADEKDNSTTVSFSTPLELVTESISETEPFDFKSGRFSGARVVVVEDDKMTRILLRKFLTKMGIEPIMTESVENGLALIIEEKPDLVISDLHMENSGGEDLLMHIRNTASIKDVPVLIISGDAFKEAREAILRAGANGFLTKPLLYNDLYISLSKLIRHFEVF